MSRTPSSASSSPGAQVATRSSGGAFAVLTLIATVFLIVGIVVVILASQKQFGYKVPFGDDYTNAKKSVADASNKIKTDNQKVTDLLTMYDLNTGLSGHVGVPAEAPAASGPTTPAVTAPPPVAPASAAAASTDTTAAPATTAATP